MSEHKQAGYFYLCLAAMHRMWSSKVKVADRRGAVDRARAPADLKSISTSSIESFKKVNVFQNIFFIFGEIKTC